MELVAAQLQEAVCRGDTERMHVEVTHFMNSTVTAEQLFDLLKLQTNNGTTFLHQAAYKGQTELMTIVNSTMNDEQWYNLLKISTHKGGTPLHYAVYSGQTATAEQWNDLLEISANYGETPLHRAACFGHIEMIEHFCNTVTAKQWYHLLNMGTCVLRCTGVMFLVFSIAFSFFMK